jgi:hypothetical protein
LEFLKPWSSGWVEGVEEIRGRRESEESDRDAFVGEVAIAVDEAIIDDVVGGGGDREDGGVEWRAARAAR